MWLTSEFDLFGSSMDEVLMKIIFWIREGICYDNLCVILQYLNSYGLVTSFLCTFIDFKMISEIFVIFRWLKQKMWQCNLILGLLSIYHVIYLSTMHFELLLYILYAYVCMYNQNFPGGGVSRVKNSQKMLKIIFKKVKKHSFLPILGVTPILPGVNLWLRAYKAR